jgi:hypothetical protein
MDHLNWRERALYVALRACCVSSEWWIALCQAIPVVNLTSIAVTDKQLSNPEVCECRRQVSLLCMQIFHVTIKTGFASFVTSVSKSIHKHEQCNYQADLVTQLKLLPPFGIHLGSLDGMDHTWVHPHSPIRTERTPREIL